MKLVQFLLKRIISCCCCFFSLSTAEFSQLRWSKWNCCVFLLIFTFFQQHISHSAHTTHHLLSQSFSQLFIIQVHILLFENIYHFSVFTVHVTYITFHTMKISVDELRQYIVRIKTNIMEKNLLLFHIPI